MKTITYRFNYKSVLGFLFMLWFFNIAKAHPALDVLKEQDSTSIKASDKAEQLYKSQKFPEVLAFCKQELSVFLNQKVKDSSQIAWLSYYQFETQFRLKNYLESIKSTALGLSYCPDNTDFEDLKAILYYKQAYAEDKLNFPFRSRKSMLQAAHLLSLLKKPNDDYLIGAYNFLSIDAAYHGNLEDAERYLRLAEKIYQNNKKQIDLARTDGDGNYDRYEVILAYKKVYLLYKQGKSTEDSLKITALLKSFNRLHDSPEFNKKHERIYYSTALNHIGDWYASYKADSLLTKKDLKFAQKYIDQSLDLILNKGYPGNYFTFQFNKCKVLTHASDLLKADKLINHLLDSMPKAYGGKPFFLAQKGLIKSKLKQKDSALIAYHKAIETIHSSDEKLSKDFRNFKPNEVFNQTKLILRIVEKLNAFYNQDIKVQKLVAQLYYLAFIQFENSYIDTKFNANYNAMLRKIIQGILSMKQKGYGLQTIPNEDLLNRSETMMNRLAWKKFNQNRYTTNLSGLDSLSYRKLRLRTLMTDAKLNKDEEQQDSIRQLIDKNSRYTQEVFPNLNLFNEASFELKRLQNNLKSDEIVIKYLVLDQKLVIFKVTKNTLHLKLKPWTQTEKDLVIQFSEAIKRKEYNASSAEELGELLMPEINSTVKHITINPDEVLYRLPFENLRLGNEYIIEKYRLSYTSNLGFIYPELSQNNINEGLAIYVPDYAETDIKSNTRNKKSILIGAKKEAEVIAKLFSSTIYSGANLTKQDFIETSKKSSLLHLAMHAEVNNEDPGLSRLLLSKTESEHLYLEELYGLSLSAELVVLSACNTGIGKVNAGQSMESFQRAFTFAGVPATVASLWEIPDYATQQIMASFYEYLSKGLSKSKALQRAKLDYLKANANTKLAEPYYWAGFVLYGDDKAVVAEEANSFWYAFLFFGVLFSMVALFHVRKMASTVS